MEGEQWLRTNYRHEDEILDKYILPKNGYFDPTYIDPKNEPRMNSTVIDELEFDEDYDENKSKNLPLKRVYKKKNMDYWELKSKGEMKIVRRDENKGQK